jgi:hypothetical protein
MNGTLLVYWGAFALIALGMVVAAGLIRSGMIQAALIAAEQGRIDRAARHGVPGPREAP